MSLASLRSSASVGSIESLASVASLRSLGSAGSILSIGSAGSILSVGSAGSIMSVRSDGRILHRGGRRMSTGDAVVHALTMSALGMATGILVAVTLRVARRWAG